MATVLNRYFNCLKHLHLQLTEFRDRYHIQDDQFNSVIFLIESDLLLVLCVLNNIEVPASFIPLVAELTPGRHVSPDSPESPSSHHTLESEETDSD